MRTGIVISDEVECHRLRVEDIDFDQFPIVVRDGKGGKDRATILTASSIEPLRRRIEHVRAVHQTDLRDGFRRVHLPRALTSKYPEVDRHPGWPYLFPSGRRATDPRTRIVRRHHPAKSALQKAVKRAVRAAGIVKHAENHGFGNFVCGSASHVPYSMLKPSPRSDLWQIGRRVFTGDPARDGISSPEQSPHSACRH